MGETRGKSLKKKESKNIYCRRCMEEKNERDFYTAVDYDLDKNGKMSICKSCCNDVFDSSFTIEQNFEKALLRTCRILNVAWDGIAVSAAKSQIDKWQIDGKKDIQFFGIYKSKLSSFAGRASSGLSSLVFNEYPNLEMSSEEEASDEEKNNNSYEELKAFWGDYPLDKLIFLQEEFNKLGAAEAKDDRAKIIILKQICYQLLVMEDKRLSGDTNVEKEFKVLDAMLKSAAIRPDQKKVGDGNRSSDAFGVWISDIEQYRPAEWYEDQDIYKDVSNFKEMLRDHVLRPFLNFWGFQRDFNFEGAVDTEEALGMASGDDDE